MTTAPETGAAAVDDIVETMGERVRRTFGAAIGRPQHDLITPALVLDLAAAKRNIATMAATIAGLSAEIRPHIKVHKSPQIARLQIEAGAIGLSVATVWEAVVMARSGFDHLFVVNTVAGEAKLRTLAVLARDVDLMVAVDDPANAADLAAAARAAGTTIGVFIEVDTGMDRCGVDTPEAGVSLARAIGGMRGIELRGVTGYEGHCALTPDRMLRHERQQAAMAMLVATAELIERDGIHCRIRSAGGTVTWDWTAAYPGITEIQAGTYVLMDTFHGAMVGGFEHALSVQATVISTPPGRVIVDAGSKSIGDADLAVIAGHTMPVFRFDEEHGIFDSTAGSSLRVGDSVSILPGYAPSTVNWFDAYHVVEQGTIVDVWPVIPRGPGHHGLLLE